MQPPKTHVPAWKRLGLKLKFAKEAPVPSPVSTSNGAGIQNGVSGINDHSIAIPPLKKRRLEEPAEGQLIQAVRSSRSSFRNPSNALKKKVSFTQETKELDGDSSKSLMDAWEERSRNEQIEEFLARQAQEAEAASSKQSSSSDSAKIPKEPIDTQPSDPPARPKREKKPNSKSKPIPTLPRKSADALDYLSQHHTAKSTWKFNKNREIWILKHILSVADIPPSHNAALVDYIAGLHSQGGRARLALQCRECVGEGEREVSVEGSEVDAKVQRAHILLKCLNPQLNSEVETTSTAAPPHTNGVKPTPTSLPKKRKNRTVVVDYSSSSESSSSSNSSDSDSDSDSNSDSDFEKNPPTIRNSKSIRREIEERNGDTNPERLESDSTTDSEESGNGNGENLLVNGSSSKKRITSGENVDVEEDEETSSSGED